MFLIPSMARFEHTITWEIKDFSKYPIQLINNMWSPEISIKLLDLTIWKLFIQAKKDMLNCELKRMDSSNMIEEIDVEYSACFIGKNNAEYFHNSGKFMATVKEPNSCTMLFLPQLSSQDQVLRDAALVIKGNLIFTVNQKHILYRLFDPHLIKLSLDISKLLESGLFSDFTLKSGKTEFKVHKCILSACWPYAISPNATNEIKLISPEILDAILKYVYLHTVIKTDAELVSDLLISARNCQLPDLECKLKKYPAECHISSTMCKRNLIFNYDLTRIAMWPESFPTHVRILPISDLSVNDLMVTFSLAKDSKGRKYLGISLQFSAFNKSRPVFVVCKMSVVNQVNHTMNTLEYKNIFERDEEWIIPPYFTEETYPTTIAQQLKLLTCNVYMCEGIDEFNTEYISTRYVANRSECFLNYPVKLSNSLYALQETALYYDVDLMVRECHMRLHKAILGARSPWFKDYFIRNNIGPSDRCTIGLNDYKYNTIKHVITYIYSGRIDIGKIENFMELLKAANFFELPHLKKLLS